MACAVKGGDFQWVQIPTRQLSLQPVAIGAVDGGNEAAEASRWKGSLRRLREHAGRNVSER